MHPEGMKRELVETRHGTLHVWRTAPIAGPPPLVCLHMSPQSGRQFHPIAPLLSDERELLLVDRLGFGHSDPVPRPWSSSSTAAISQPLLGLAPKDDIWVQTQRGLEMLPAQAQVVDLSHLTHEIFALHAAELAGHIRPFLAAAD